MSDKKKYPEKPEKVNGKTLTVFFCELYEYYLEESYLPSWQKDGKLIRDLYKHYGDRLFDIMDHYLSTGKVANNYWSQQPRTVGLMRLNANAIREHMVSVRGLEVNWQ